MSWIPAGGGAVAPEVGGVGPHPVHLLRLQLLHPSSRLRALAPVNPSTRLVSPEELNQVGGRISPNWLPAKGGGGSEWWPGRLAGGGGDREEQISQSGRRTETPTAQTKRPRPRRHDSITTSLDPPVKGTWPLASASASVSLPLYGHLGGERRPRAAPASARRLPPDLGASSAAADFHFHTKKKESWDSED